MKQVFFLAFVVCCYGSVEASKTLSLLATAFCFGFNLFADRILTHILQTEKHKSFMLCEPSEFLILFSSIAPRWIILCFVLEFVCLFCFCFLLSFGWDRGYQL